MADSTTKIVHIFTKFPRTSKGCQTKIKCSQRSILRFDHPPEDPVRVYPNEIFSIADASYLAAKFSARSTKCSHTCLY